MNNDKRKKSISFTGHHLNISVFCTKIRTWQAIWIFITKEVTYQCFKKKKLVELNTKIETI